MSSRKLYEITHDFKALIAQAEEQEGEISDDFDRTLMGIELELNDKLAACCCVIKNARAEAKMYGDEIKRLKALKDRQDAISERVEKYVESCVVPGVAWEQGPHKLAWRKSEAVELAEGVSIDEVPEAYRDTVITLRKAEAKRDLKQGADLWFCEVKERQNLQIK